MEVVRKVVEDELHLQIPIAGLAKDDHHRTHELLYGFPPQVVGMKTDSPLFHLLTHIQDEVHRYAITFHRQKRSKHHKEGIFMSAGDFIDFLIELGRLFIGLLVEG